MRSSTVRCVMLPEYAACPCGEFRRAALRQHRPQVICRNCADRSHPRRLCIPCGRFHLPNEQHHIAGRPYSSATIPLCLNCHAVVSDRQYGWPKLLAEFDSELPLAHQMAMIGCLDLILLAWSQSSLQTAPTWLKVIRSLGVGLYAVAAVMKEGTR